MMMPKEKRKTTWRLGADGQLHRFARAMAGPIEPITRSSCGAAVAAVATMNESSHAKCKACMLADALNVA